jgi:hypothetical protein
MLGGTSPMNTPSPYVFSRLEQGDTAVARECAFTRWMSKDLLQVAIDFYKNIGHVPVYCESSKQGTRCILWRMPAGAGCDIRFGCTQDKFFDFNCANEKRDLRLLSLYMSEDELYSAVWVSLRQYDFAVAYLQLFGISPAQVRNVEQDAGAGVNRFYTSQLSATCVTPCREPSLPFSETNGIGSQRFEDPTWRIRKRRSLMIYFLNAATVTLMVALAGFVLSNGESYLLPIIFLSAAIGCAYFSVRIRFNLMGLFLLVGTVIFYTLLFGLRFSNA